MDYFQGVITEYLRAKRTTFVNTEYLLQLDANESEVKDRHWYCDAVAVDHADATVDLCEVSYSKTLHALFKRLQAWSDHWPEVVAAIHRDSALKGDWCIRPRVFIPQETYDMALLKIARLIRPAEQVLAMPDPVVTPMEQVLPWRYRSWNQKPYEDELHVR